MNDYRIYKDYFLLCKPKVIGLMLITTWIGMILASSHLFTFQTFLFATLGISLAAGSAAVINHLVDRKIDAKMRRTENRPIASGRINPLSALLFSILLGVSGLLILFFLVNPLTALFTSLTVIGYAGFYTLFLKRATPQNIVIGGIAGAMPPLLGWMAVSNNINPHALLLSLIIFIWTPPHAWALAIYRREDYAKANIPMLPITHGVKFTKLCIVLYTILLLATSLLPYATGMSGPIYFILALLLGITFFWFSLTLYKTKNEYFSLKTFYFSILYLFLLFLSLLIDHFIHL